VLVNQAPRGWLALQDRQVRSALLDLKALLVPLACLARRLKRVLLLLALNTSEA
jgi:hypothetical protein